MTHDLTKHLLARAQAAENRIGSRPDHDIPDPQAALVAELRLLRADARTGLGLLTMAVHGIDSKLNAKALDHIGSVMQEYVDGHHATETAFWETPKDETPDPPSTEEKTPI